MAKEELLKREIRLDIIVPIILKHWKSYIKPVAITAALAVVFVLLIPRTYSVTVKLAPEYGSSGSALSGLASSFGIDLGGLDGADAIVPLYYPDVITSTQFCVPLFDVRVKCQNSDFEGTYYNYLMHHTKRTPWKSAFMALRKLFDTKDKTAKKAGDKTSPFSLSRVEDNIFRAVKNNITCTVDKKTDIITLSVDAQDPLVAAQLADSVMQHLQDFIIDYRTRKARIDLQHYKEIKEEKQQKYDNLLGHYLSFADANRDVMLPSLRRKAQDRENELQEAYEELSMAKKQLALTETKLTERTPAFTVLQNSTVPLKPSAPKRMIIVAALVMLCIAVKSILLIRKYNK